MPSEISSVRRATDSRVRTKKEPDRCLISSRDLQNPQVTYRMSKRTSSLDPQLLQVTAMMSITATFGSKVTADLVLCTGRFVDSSYKLRTLAIKLTLGHFVLLDFARTVNSHKDGETDEE